MNICTRYIYINEHIYEVYIYIYYIYKIPCTVIVYKRDIKCIIKYIYIYVYTRCKSESSYTPTRNLIENLRQILNSSYRYKSRN